jgi:N-acetylmuramic acid 6-phosphate etherase
MVEDNRPEIGDADSVPLDELSASALVDRMNREDSMVAAAVSAQRVTIARAIETISDRLRTGGRMIYLGAGTSGRLGYLDAVECLSTFGTDPAHVVAAIAGGIDSLHHPNPGAEDDVENGRNDMAALNLSPLDVVVGVTASGSTPYVLGGLGVAREMGAVVAVVCCNPNHSFSGISDEIIVIDVGPEVIAGSTRLKAGTAIKMVLNMLSTGAMVLCGKTFGDQMVDLMPLNEKLRSRARDIVTSMTGLAEDQVETLLESCDGEIKTAILVNRFGVRPVLAREWLSESNGGLRKALSRSTSSRILTPAPILNKVEPRTLVVGIDAGGSKTIAIVGEASLSGGPLGRGLSGPGNVAEGFERATHSILAAIAEARAEAACLPGPFAAICLAVAGSGAEESRRMLEQWAMRINLAEKVLLVHDASPVLAMVAQEGPGIALIAGTGSIAFGRNSRGETARAGGWGWMVGEESNGHGIAVAALRTVVRAADGLGPATQLTDGFLRWFGVKDERSILTSLGRSDTTPAKVARLAEIVVDAAARGDQVSLQILSVAAQQLAALTAAVYAKLQLTSGSFTLGLAGGLLINNQLLQDLLGNCLRNLQVVPRNVVTVETPALGSLRLAQSALVEY